MNITNQLQQILVFLAQNGFETVLKKMTVSAMTPVIVNSLTGKYPAHDHRNSRCSSAEQQMNMLCEAPDYVKLRFWTSAYPLISVPQPSNSLHIIHGPWQAY